MKDNVNIKNICTSKEFDGLSEFAPPVEVKLEVEEEEMVRKCIDN